MPELLKYLYQEKLAREGDFIEAEPFQHFKGNSRFVLGQESLKYELRDLPNSNNSSGYVGEIVFKSGSRDWITFLIIFNSQDSLLDANVKIGEQEFVFTSPYIHDFIRVREGRILDVPILLTYNDFSYLKNCSFFWVDRDFPNFYFRNKYFDSYFRGGGEW